MTDIGQIERNTHNRVVQLFHERLEEDLNIVSFISFIFLHSCVNK
jgi:hypothetical protein